MAKIGTTLYCVKREDKNGAYRQHALEYLNAGYSPLAIKQGSKRPVEEAWSELCDRPHSEAEIQLRIGRYDRHGIGIALGYNGVIAIDVDTEHPEIIGAIKSALPRSAFNKRGKKGWTLFFRYVSGEAPSRHLKGKDKTIIVDILGYGCQTVLPPTIHPETKQEYTWYGASLLECIAEDLPALTAEDLEALEAALKPYLWERPSWSADELSCEVRAPGRPFNDIDRRRYERNAEMALAARTKNVAETPAGARNGALFSDMCYISKQVHHGILSEDAVIAAMMDACHKNGLVRDDGAPACLATIRSALYISRNDPLPMLKDRPRPEDWEQSQDAKTGSPGDEWSELQPLFATIARRRYPVEVLPGLIQDAVREVQGFMQTPVEMAALSALAAASASVQHLADVARGERLAGPVSLWTLVVAKSGERKTALDDHFTKHIRAYEAVKALEMKPAVEAAKKQIAAHQAKEKGLLAAIEKCAKDGKPDDRFKADLNNMPSAPEMPRVPFILRGDDTTEALAYSLAHVWPSGALLESEGGTMLGSHSMGTEKITYSLAVKNKAWDGGQHPMGRRTSESYVLRDVRFTQGLQVQPAVLREFQTKNGALTRGIGFWARFLFADPKSTQGTRFWTEPPENTPKLGRFQARLSELLETKTTFTESGGLDPVKLMLSPEGKTAWIEAYNSIEDKLGDEGELDAISDIASKAADNVARIAAIFHVIENGPSGAISAENVSRAAALVDWHLHEARRFFADMSASPEERNAADLERWLIQACKAKGSTSVSRRDAQREFGRGSKQGGVKVDKGLAVLAELGRARLVIDGGKKSIEVRPELVDGGTNAPF